MTLPDDYVERSQALDSFIRCPSCGDEDATLEFDENAGTEKCPEIRATCYSCGFTTPWLYGTLDADDKPDLEEFGSHKTVVSR